MQCAAHNGFIYIDIPVPDFQVEAAIGISTDPGFVVDIGSLAAKIG